MNTVLEFFGGSLNRTKEAIATDKMPLTLRKQLTDSVEVYDLEKTWVQKGKHDPDTMFLFYILRVPSRPRQMINEDTMDDEQ